MDNCGIVDFVVINHLFLWWRGRGRLRHAIETPPYPLSFGDTPNPTPPGTARIGVPTMAVIQSIKPWEYLYSPASRTSPASVPQYTTVPPVSQYATVPPAQATVYSRLQPTKSPVYGLY